MTLKRMMDKLKTWLLAELLCSLHAVIVSPKNKLWCGNMINANQSRFVYIFWHCVNVVDWLTGWMSWLHSCRCRLLVMAQCYLSSDKVCFVGFPGRVCDVSQLLPRPAFWGGCWLHVSPPVISYSVSNTWSFVWLRVWLDDSEAESRWKQSSSGKCWGWASTDNGSRLASSTLWLLSSNICLVSWNCFTDRCCCLRHVVLFDKGLATQAKQSEESNSWWCYVAAVC